jgi:leader peptidase (prepilin peptidase)/N-methyltransferase
MIYELIEHHTWFIYTALGLLSLAVGSLLNVIIYRLPIMLEREWKEEYNDFIGLKDVVKEEPINLFFPRSFCPDCKTKINAWQNIPILSYILLRGRCYQCKSTISPRYPLIEFGTLLLSLYASWHFGISLQLIFILSAIWILICLFFIDLDHQILPDSLTLSLLWIGLIANTENLFTPLPQAVLSSVAGYLGLWIFIKIFYLFTGKIGMGNGDFKLFAAFGAWFGWIFFPLILLFSSISGIIFGLIYLRLHDKTIDATIPFGPFLCASGLITLFWGQNIVNWYLHFWM